MVTRVGMIGLSAGNGHPFSFSAIVNGYDRAAFEKAGWPVILDYLQRQPAAAFGFDGVSVTHAWTQDAEVTAALAAACRIDRAVARPEDMLGEVDAVIVARDDWECHGELALPFLEHGVAVFVDKPLTLEESELERFRPYLERGKLMSTSGLRYAAELDAVRDRLEALRPLRLVAATVLNGIEKYGIHMLDAVAGLGLPRAIAVTRLDAPHQSYLLTLEDGTPMHLDCLGAVARTFRLVIFGDGGHIHADLHDNFTAFRRTLDRFVRMISDSHPPIAPGQVVDTMRLIRRAAALVPGETAELGHA